MPSPLENELTALTKPINGQYPRPWMTNLKNPENAKVFIVGANPATAYKKREHVKSHPQFLDIHFNRNGYNCRSFYEYVREKDGKTDSPSRNNIGALTNILKEKKILSVLETNIYCYSTSRFRDLKEIDHPCGKERGLYIFKSLLAGIRPKVLILHGAGVRKEFVKQFDGSIPKFPMDGSIPVKTKELFKKKVRFLCHTSVVFVIPSLSAPGWNHWSSWSEDYLVALSRSVKRHLR